MIDKNKVVLVTTTFSKSLDDYRAQLALKSCKAARENGYRLIIVDGSLCLEYKLALRSFGAEVIDQTEPGMGPSRRQCIRAGLATNAEAIGWFEPEKHTLIPLLEPCIEPVIRGYNRVLIPRRRSLESYPLYQAWSEYYANHLLHGITGRALDYYIGPRILSRAAAEIMATYAPDPKLGFGDNWEILFLPLLKYMERGWVIGSVTVDYVHPPEQMVEDNPAMREKRDKQRHDLVSAMAAEAKRLGINGLQ